MDIKIALGKIEQYWQIIRNLHFHIEQEGKISPEEYALIEKYLKVITLKYKDLVEVESEDFLSNDSLKENITFTPHVPAPAPMPKEVSVASQPVEEVVDRNVVPAPTSVVDEIEPLQNKVEEDPIYFEEPAAPQEIVPVIEAIAPEIVAETPKSTSISAYLERMLENPEKVPDKPLLFTQESVEKKAPSLNDKLKEMKSPVDDLNSKIKKATAEKISLNDKFEFIRELFGNNSIEYANAIQIFDTEGSFAWEKVVAQYAERFNWSAKPGSVEKLRKLVSSR